MEVDRIKSNLRDFYNREAEHRNAREKQGWKLRLRDTFCDFAIQENKKTLLEIGAGTGHDSIFFMDRGFQVVAVDLSGEMVKICKEKSIDARELDFYDLSVLNQRFDCIWSMNSLLHVPKTDLKKVLLSIDSVLKEKGLFFMGVYGGKDREHHLTNDCVEIPRFFASYSEGGMKEILRGILGILSFEQFDTGEGIDFQAVTMRKK